MTINSLPPEIIIEAQDLSRSFIIDHREIPVLQNVSLAVSTGEFVVIDGRSGSGKTTLLTLLSGLDRPTSGRIFIQGKDVTDFSEDALAPMRNRTFGFVFQSFHLVPSLTALENITFPAELRGDAEGVSRGEELLRRVDLLDRRNSFPRQLSGGEKQRVAICRALINRPRIVFADEPTGNLDSISGDEVLNLLLTLRREEGTALVLVTHNRELAGRADRVLHLQDGRIFHDEIATT
ncbi:MAG: ABC transporter ATP-binding protein [Proteobacteria bacterium]|nr:ABC transporter ATP-binding protein [Pseudomonadota bacterium]MBU1688836.1 ABC transporter ATP-binding protein [Pseudomonadota bacterium]